MKYCLLIINLLLLPFSLSANDGVKLLCSPREDAILLRWAPTTPYAWEQGNAYGYTIERYTILKGKDIPPHITIKQLNEQPLQPVALEDWEEHLEDDKYVMIAAECIFGETDNAADGTSPMSIYKQQKEHKQRYSFAMYAADQSATVANLSGLYWRDNTAQEDEKYLYKVFINSPDSIALDTASAFVGIAEYTPLPQPSAPVARWNDKSVYLSWNYAYQKHIYNSYIVEKSMDGGNHFQPLNENATVQLSDKGVNPMLMGKTDSLANNTDSVYYRIKGVSAFGEMSPASEVIGGVGQLPITESPVLVNHKVINNADVKLYWDYPQEMNPYISGFKIYRSSKAKGKKDVIYQGTDSDIREFTDSEADFTNYYLISVYNSSKEKLSLQHTYVERIDSFPPSAPSITEQSIDSLGQLQLRWQQATDNDIYGYRVYKANHPRDEFISTTSAALHDTLYTDTINLNVLNEYIYYKVRAVDLRQNLSPFSELITVRRPDIIPPVAPVLKDIKESKRGVEVFWLCSSSSDVENHLIYRKLLDDTQFTEIAKVPSSNERKISFIDKEVMPGCEYVYAVKAQDEAALLSPSSNYGYYHTPSEKELSIKLKKKVYSGGIKLSWVVKHSEEVEKVLIYRQKNDDELVLYGNSTSEEFIDKDVVLENKYKYRIKLVYTNGGSSVLSQSVSISL